MKDFDAWNIKKRQINDKDKGTYVKEREIWFTSIGHNIGYEQDGKGDEFLRPVIVIKRFNAHVFWGVPLTSTQKEGKYYFPFIFKGKESVAIISQLKLFSSKRMVRKMGIMRKDYYDTLCNNLIGLMVQ